MTRPAISALIVVSAISSACRQDMQDQPKYPPLRASTFFDDNRSARPLVGGTVARGQMGDDVVFETGKAGTTESNVFPIAVDLPLLARGRERFDIYCSPCHGRTGDGNGMIVQRGFRHPPSYHIDRLRDAPPGHFVDVILNGFGAMPDFADRTDARDRWAITAYIRALQLSEHATVNDVPASRRGALQ